MNACGESLAENQFDPCLRQAKLTHLSQINEIILNEGKPRLFVATLRYSRRSFRRVVWRSSQQVWAKLHEQAWLRGLPFKAMRLVSWSRFRPLRARKHGVCSRPRTLCGKPTTGPAQESDSDRRVDDLLVVLGEIVAPDQLDGVLAFAAQ